ncbi:PREDICTED: uncharacterized protein LOC108576164 [Habropoda laboriosa]|uniref:uncharacterized protein LOC108576164 n=1 Tax=Habropoda laboriosa TaxID=597456 RepID=UPI00083D6D81|nr:PREDICTED: uncharacterized protein LOC108576164 [Habropoda laboriosa]
MILPTFLLALQQMNYLKHLATINQPIEHLLKTVTFLDVQFVVQSPFGINSEVIDDTYKTVSRILPTSCISLNDSVPAILPSFRTSHGTLIFYAYVSKNLPNVKQMDDMIRVIVHDNNRPKVLLLTILEEENCSFEVFLKKMWQRQVIDVMILEVSKSDSHEIAIKVHQYNPFTNVYDRQPYKSSMQWFPNKMTNLYGYPLKVYIVERLGHIWMTKNSEGYPVIYNGSDAKALKVLARAMNFSIALVPNRDGNEIWALTLNSSIDIVIPMMPYFPEHINSTPAETIPLSSESWCAVTPITYKYEIVNLQPVTGIVINLIVVLIFWVVSILMKFSSNTWKPIKIFALIISTSIPIRPKRTSEKIIFLNIVLVSALYSTNLYADLTTHSLEERTAVKYENFKQLDASGFTPVVLDVLMNLTFTSGDETFRALKRKAIGINNTVECVRYLEKHRNVTCFMELKEANTIMYNNRRKGKEVIQVNKNLCYAKPPTGYYLGKYAPYKNRIEEILVRLEQSGIRETWYRNKFEETTTRRRFIREAVTVNQYSFMWNLVDIAGCGWLISLVAFFGEQMASHLSSYEKRTIAE